MNLAFTLVMRELRESLNNRVVVMTGASSGIGRAAAIAFADAGCRVVVAARRTEALDATIALCRRRPGSVVAVPTDVTVAEDLERLVDRTLELWGRIDVWVNNAGTTLFGRLDEGAFAQHVRVIETNLLAPMYVARLVIPIFRRQKRGIMINIGSVLSDVGQAFVPSYTISKFGIRGLSETLRSEVADYPDVHVCTLLPYAVDTPHFEEGANAIGRRAFAMPPVQDPSRVAAALVDLAERPRRLRYVPGYAPLGLMAHWMWPRTTERLLRHALDRFHLVGTTATSDGSLYTPQRSRGAIRGMRPPVAGFLRVACWVGADLVGMALARWQSRGRGWHPSWTS